MEEAASTCMCTFSHLYIHLYVDLYMYMYMYIQVYVDSVQLVDCLTTRTQTCTCTSHVVYRAVGVIGCSVVLYAYYNLGTHAQRGLRSVILSVRVPCFLPLRTTRRPKIDIPTGLGLILKMTFSTAFTSYVMKTKRTSQYANEHGLPRPDSARFEHGGGSRRS